MLFKTSLGSLGVFFGSFWALSGSWSPLGGVWGPSGNFWGDLGGPSGSRGSRGGSSGGIFALHIVRSSRVRAADTNPQPYALKTYPITRKWKLTRLGE